MTARSARILILSLAASTIFCASAAFAQTAAPSAPPAAPAAPPAAQPDAKPAAPARTDLPDAKEILNRSIEAMGGEKAFNDLQSSMIKATMSTPMGDLALEMNWMKPDMVFIKQSMPGMDSTMGSDGTTSWVKSPMGYELLKDDQARQMQEQSNMLRMVVRMRDESKELKTVDQVKFGEFDCYKVSATDKDGLEQFAFFDSKDSLIRGIESTQETQMGQVTSTIKFSEWKEAAGIKYFTKIDIEQMGMAMTLTFTEVAFNTLEASAFTLPPEVKAMVEAASKPADAAPAAPASDK